MERKTGRSGSNRMILVNSKVSNRMILIRSNVRKFFRKQHTNTSYFFANRRSFDESMDKKFF